MAYVRIKQGAFIVIKDGEDMLEVWTDTKEEALKLAEKYFGNNENMVVCKIPGVINYINPKDKLYQLLNDSLNITT